MNSPEAVVTTEDAALDSGKVATLRKAAGALAITKASQSITLVGRKVFNVLVWMAQQDPSARQWTMPLTQVARRIEYGSRNYELLKEACRKMMSTVVEWESPVRDEPPIWRAATLLAGVDLSQQGGQLSITWSFAHNLQPELLDPQRFARVRMDTVARLRTVAALELYQICSRYKDNPSHLTSRRPWLWWHEALRLHPGKPAKPPQFKFFKRDTLAPAIAEVNAVTELWVELVPPTKVGRTIQDLQFRVRLKDSMSAERAPRLADLELAEVIDRAIRLGLSEDAVEDLLERYGEPEIVRALDQLESRGASHELGRVTSPARWIEGFLSKSTTSTEVTAGQGAVGASKVEALTTAQRTAALRHREERIAYVWTVYQGLDFEVREAHKADFVEQVLERGHQAYLENWRLQGVAGRLAGPLFKRFLCDRLLGPGWDNPPVNNK